MDRYRITEVLGAGGMSRVYGAIQDGLDRKVAIKLLAPAGADDLSPSQFDNLAARFEREAKLISSFRSSHTVVMYDFGRSADYLFMILENVEGQNLHQLVKETGPLPAARVARIMRQALGSLAEAHERGILHRDIKPQNIMVYEHLGEPDNVKVLDFGIAKAIGETGRDVRKLTEERVIVGTPSYMSPEQILGNQLSPSSDIYSLGLVAYELLFGIVAIEADSAVSTMARHLAPTPIEIPTDRGMPAGFLDILRKMISKDAAQRHQSATEVLADLNAWDGGDSSLTGAAIGPMPRDTLESPYGGPQTTQSSRPLVVTGALLTVAILVAVGVVVALVWMMSTRSSSDGAASSETVPEPAAVVVAPVVEEVIAEAETIEEEVVAAPEEAPPEEPPEAVAAVEVEPTPPPVEVKQPVAKPKKPEPVEPVAKVPPVAAAVEEPEPTPDPEPPPQPTVVTVTPKPEPVKTVAAPTTTAKKTTTTTAKDPEDDPKAKKKKKVKPAPPLSF